MNLELFFKRNFPGAKLKEIKADNMSLQFNYTKSNLEYFTRVTGGQVISGVIPQDGKGYASNSNIEVANRMNRLILSSEYQSWQQYIAK